MIFQYLTEHHNALRFSSRAHFDWEMDKPSDSFSLGVLLCDTYTLKFTDGFTWYHLQHKTSYYMILPFKLNNSVGLNFKAGLRLIESFAADKLFETPWLSIVYSEWMILDSNYLVDKNKPDSAASMLCSTTFPVMVSQAKYIVRSGKNI